MIKIYAQDLKEELRNDAFMGKGFEEAVKKANEDGDELVVGELYKEWRFE